MKDAERAEGTFAAHLRHASVFLEQTRVMEARKWRAHGVEENARWCDGSRK